MNSPGQNPRLPAGSGNKTYSNNDRERLSKSLRRGSPKNMAASVLLVEDDPLTNRINKEFIEAADFADHVHICVNGKEAIDHLIQALHKKNVPVPDVIFLDINMPEMNGWEFLKEFRLLTPRINKPVLIFIQSSLRQEDLSQLHEFHEITGHIAKPLNLSVINHIKEKYFA